MNTATTYENAPATLLLATHCAACGRALVDAISVETGMGPDCREKHGYGDAQSDPDLLTFAALLDEEAIDYAQLSPQAAANKLVHLVACGKGTGRHVAAIDALGFKVLAAKLGERAHAVRVEQVDGLLVVHAPYSPEFNAAVRAVPGQRFCKEGKDAYRTVPVSSRAALWTALKKAFPAGTTVFGTKRAAVL